jgi:hypothetical protein
MPLDYRPLLARWLAGALTGVIGLGPQVCGADAVAEQIERAVTWREIAARPPSGPGGWRAIPGPGSARTAAPEAAQRQTVVIDNDLRWRNLLADQARERHSAGAHLGARQVRAGVSQGMQAEQELHRVILHQDLEYRLRAAR